ncbi:MAG: hypothetical protein AB7K68_06725 [Bacteriovoracia bacterium]
MTWRNLFVVAVAIMALSGCTRKAALPNTPEGTLEKYVSAAFEVRGIEDRKHLMDLSSGDAYAHLEKMTDEEFKKQFIETKLKFIGLKAKDLREETGGDVSLVYELTYQDGNGTVPPTRHTNKKIAYLGRAENGDWKIKATKNIKTFLERKEDLVITPETTHKDEAAEQK